jgi:hypothetical protein
VRPYPLLGVGVFAFMLALNSFGLVLIAQAPQPGWLWAFNGVVMASQIVAFVCCCQRARMSSR